MMMLITFIPVPNAHAAGNEPELRNLAKDSTYEWSEAPDDRYPDTGNKLTDGKTGGTNVLDPAWTGHLQKQTREIVFDLGEAKSISSIKSHFLQDWPGSAILFPLTVSMYVSNDNVNWERYPTRRLSCCGWTVRPQSSTMCGTEARTAFQRRDQTPKWLMRATSK